MRDGGKGDKRRPLAVPEEQFNNQWDAIFGNKDELNKTLRELVDKAPLSKQPKVPRLIQKLIDRIKK